MISANQYPMAEPTHEMRQMASDLVRTYAGSVTASDILGEGKEPARSSDKPTLLTMKVSQDSTGKPIYRPLVFDYIDSSSPLMRVGDWLSMREAHEDATNATKNVFEALVQFTLAADAGFDLVQFDPPLGEAAYYIISQPQLNPVEVQA